MSRKQKTTTVENRQEQRGVADWLQPYMQDMAPRAQALLNTPTQQYQGPLVAPFGAETESGLRGLMGYAQQGVPGLDLGYRAVQQAMTGRDPGAMAMLRAAYGPGNPLAGQIAGGQTTAGLDLINRAAQANPIAITPAETNMRFGVGAVPTDIAARDVAPNVTAQDVLANFAPGQTTAGLDLINRGGQANQYTGRIGVAPVTANFTPGQTTAGMDVLSMFANQDVENPYLDRTFDRASNRVRNQIIATMAQAGMPGSGAHQDLLQQGLGDLATQIYGGAYEATQGRRMGAAQALGQFQQADLARALQAQGMSADVAQANAARALQAQGINADLAAADRAAAVQAGSQLAGLQQTDLARSLQAQGMGADVAQANAARALQAQGINADIAQANAARNLQAQGMNADIAQANMARELQAQGMSAEQAQANAARMMQAQLANADIAAADRTAALQAGGQLAGLQQADLARGLQAQGMNADIFQQDAARQLQAGGLLSDASRSNRALGLQGAGMLGQLYNVGRQPFADQLAVGGTRDEQAQRMIDAERQRFEQGQLLPWQDLARYQALVNPLGQTFATGSTQGTSTQSTRTSDPLGTILGGAMMASTLFGNPLGAVMGGMGGMGSAARMLGTTLAGRQLADLNAGL